MGIDWHYFMVTSPTIEVRENHTADLLQTYYDSLQQTLKTEKFDESKIPTFDQVSDEMRRFKFYAFSSAVGILSLVLMEKNPDSEVESSLDNLMDDGDVAKKLRRAQMSGPIYQKAMISLLKEFDRDGILDS